MNIHEYINPISHRIIDISNQINSNKKQFYLYGSKDYF